MTIAFSFLKPEPVQTPPEVLEAQRLFARNACGILLKHGFKVRLGMIEKEDGSVSHSDLTMVHAHASLNTNICPLIRRLVEETMPFSVYFEHNRINFVVKFA